MRGALLEGGSTINEVAHIRQSIAAAVEEQSASTQEIGSRVASSRESAGQWCRPRSSRVRSDTAASREVSGLTPNRCSMVARIEVVSWVWRSTAKRCRSSGEMSSAGIRVPGPH